jgi:isocitrate dehydrogenase
MSLTKQIQQNQSDSLNAKAIPLTVAYGDGIGPEIMEATIQVLEALGVPLELTDIQIGQEAYLNGHQSGISDDAWDILRDSRLLLKAPITTPQGGGYKSLNVTLRKSLGLFANVRPCRAFTPYIKSHFPNMDLTIIRENEEDLYAGIEHQQTPEVVQCLKLITRPGCERIIRYAFEYARANGRSRVTCMTKDNIMKHTDGLFHQVFDEVAASYSDIEAEHYIIDIGSAVLATNPDRFEVVVAPNLYGDIISDITAQVAGSVGLGGSANIGMDFAMFEAIHGSAPDIAGRNIANPSGLLHAAAMMLTHTGLTSDSERLQNALLRTLEDGIHTPDIYNDAYTVRKVGTKDFTRAVIERLDKRPESLAPVTLKKDTPKITITIPERPRPVKKLVGTDLFIDWHNNGDRDPDLIGKALEEASEQVGWRLKMITNRGVKVYPQGLPETFCTDHWRCRFVSGKSTLAPDRKGLKKSEQVTMAAVLELQQALVDHGFDIIKTENLYELDGHRAYSLGQGE